MCTVLSLINKHETELLYLCFSVLICKMGTHVLGSCEHEINEHTPSPYKRSQMLAITSLTTTTSIGIINTSPVKTDPECWSDAEHKSIAVTTESKEDSYTREMWRRVFFPYLL